MRFLLRVPDDIPPGSSSRGAGSGNGFCRSRGGDRQKLPGGGDQELAVPPVRHMSDACDLTA